jgi:tripartite-type tricarboxylate transporter receptor subunit TctC
MDGLAQVRYDLPTLTWVGSAFRETNALWTLTDTPYGSLEAIRSASRPPKLGAQSGTHQSVVLPRLVTELTGLKFDLVTGYPGSPEIMLDVERRALDGRFDALSTLTTTRAEWIPNKVVQILLVAGRERHKDFPSVPTIAEIVPADKRHLLTLTYGTEDLTRAMAGPPGIPAEVAQVVQEAYKRMSQDPDFQAEEIKTGFEVGFSGPAEVGESLKKLLEEPELKATLKRVLSTK